MSQYNCEHEWFKLTEAEGSVCTRCGGRRPPPADHWLVTEVGPALTLVKAQPGHHLARPTRREAIAARLSNARWTHQSARSKLQTSADEIDALEEMLAQEPAE